MFTMTPHRRRCLALLAALPAAGWTQTAAWPAGQPIKIVTPSPVGVGSDTFARLYGERLGHELKTAVLVENRPGASSTLGTDAVAKSAPNGLTLLFSTSLPFTTAPYLLPRLPYNAQKDLLPVAQLYRGGSFIVASQSFPGRMLKDLVAAAKLAPDKINYASYGPGSTAHLGMEMLQDAAGIQLSHIPYKQSPLPDLMGGLIQIGWEPPVSALPNIKAGKLKALAYSGDQRSPALPDVPTLSELYPGVVLFTWVGLWAPAGTPEAVIQRLQKALLAINHDPEIAKALADVGNEPMQTTPAQMAQTLEQEAKSMSALIKAKHITMN